MTSILERATDIGSRHDPHAQGRAARSGPLLLHSLTLFREVFEEIYSRRRIDIVVEVGVETGQVSGDYAELGASRVFCVDPFPSDSMRAALAENDKLHLVEGFSPDVLADLPIADLYVIDGDHNYATVRGEVDWILANAPDAVVVFHDLMWPCGRRDFYYQPTRLSEADRHADTTEGPTVWHDQVTPAGFIGAGAFTFASEAGGERNGVLTAVEDALDAAQHSSWQLEIIPAIFGVGVMMRRTEETAELLDVIRRYSASPLLAAMENNRLALYTRILQMQHEAVAWAGDADRLAETIATQRRQIDELSQQLDHLVTEPAREREEARRRRPSQRARRLVGHQVRRIAALLPPR